MSKLDSFTNGANDLRKLFIPLLTTLQFTREFLRQIIQSKFEVIHTAPNPLREDFIVDSNPSKDTLDIEYLNTDSNIEIKTQQGISNIDGFIKYLFNMCAFDLQDYYSLTNIHSEARFAGYTMRDICNEILRVRNEALSYAAYSFFKKRLNAKKLALLIHQYYKNYTIWSNIQNQLKIEVSELQERLKNPLLTISDRLIKELSQEDLPLNSQLNILELAQHDITDYKSLAGLWLTITVSLLSAFIGGIIGILFIR